MSLCAQQPPTAVIADPPVNKSYPPGLAVVTVPSHGVELDGFLDDSFLVGHAGKAKAFKQHHM